MHRNGSFIGIDPGVSGAIALWTPDENALVVHDMPTFTVARAGSNKREVDALTLLDLLKDLKDDATKYGEPVELAIIERAWPRQGDGASTAYANGANWGVAYCAIVSMHVPVEQIAPQKWKGDMGVPKGVGDTKAALLRSRKEQSRKRASALMPTHAAIWKCAMDDGRAEAALIAQYAERLYRQRLAVAA